MKQLKRYFDFLKEAFDLNYYLNKEHIPKIIQETAINEINKWISGVRQLPIDVNKDKLILWFARNVKNILLDKFRNEYDKFYKLPHNDYQNELSLYTKLIKCVKGEIDILNDDKDKDYITFSINTINNNFTQIKDYIFSNVRNENIWKIDYTSSFKEMNQKSTEWHNSMKASGSVTSEEGYKLIEYPNGFYWIDLETNNCESEAEAMGHCGRASSDTLLSLRQKKKDGSIEPFVTVAIDYNRDLPEDSEGNIIFKGVDKEDIYTTIYQIKGKANKKPIEKYHPYIVDLYIKYNLYDLAEDRYEPETDFQISDIEDMTLFERILNERPNLIDINKIIFYKNKKITDFILNKYPDIVKNQYQVSNLYYLMEKGIITKEEFISKFPEDFVLKDGEIYLYYRKGKEQKDWKDNALQNLDFMYSNEDGNNNHYSSRDVIDNLDDCYNGGYEFKFHDLYLNHLTKEAKKAIFTKIREIKRGLSLEEKKQFRLYKSWEEQVENIDEFGDIKDAIVSAYEDAQLSADETEMYEKSIKPLLYFLEMNELIYYEEGFLFKVNPAWLRRYDEYNSNYRYLSNNIMESWFTEEGNNNEIEMEDDYLKIDIPYYGWDGSIDEKYLEECVIERLEEI